MTDLIDGDYVTRMGVDIHIVSDVSPSCGNATFTCVYSDVENGSFYEVGEVESNLIDRYGIIHEESPLYPILRGIINE